MAFPESLLPTTSKRVCVHLAALGLSHTFVLITEQRIQSGQRCRLCSQPMIDAATTTEQVGLKAKVVLLLMLLPQSDEVTSIHFARFSRLHNKHTDTG